MRSLLLPFLLFITSFVVKAQPPCSTIQGMTPQTAIAVCGTTTFIQPFVNNCSANVIPGACTSIDSKNSYWYKFHCYAPGTLGLGFVVKPVVLSDDFDWGLFDVTGHTDLNDIYTMPSMEVSVNISGVTGITGCTPAGTGNVNCGGTGFPPYNQLAPMQLGHDYMLMVTNWSGSAQGYTITFSGGDAVITNNTPPVINSVSAGCNTSSLKVVFSKDIKCPSVTNSGSEFSITPGGPVITGVTTTCSSPLGTITELTLQLQNPLAGGNYTLAVNPGTDGNTFTDACGTDMATGFQIPFTVNAVATVAVSSVNYTGCAPTVLNVALTKPIWCSSLSAAPASEFSIMPGNPAIQSIQSTCTSGSTYIDQLQIVLQNPLIVGNYQLVVNNGADGNTLVDTCGNSITAGYSFPFSISPVTPSPFIQSIVFDECHPDKVVVNFDRPVACVTISGAGSELSVGPGVWPVNSINYTCINSQYTTEITMNLANPLPAGNFSVKVGIGTDGNTISDTCFSFTPVGYSKAFVTTQAPAPIFDSVQFDNCNATALKVFYSHPILCNSISLNGSDFTITGPSAVNITSATTDVTCTASGYTHWVLLQLQSPISLAGNYVLHNGIGLDGNGIIDTCNAKQNTNETFAINILGKPSAVFNSQVNWGCVKDTILLSHPGGNAVNSWIWNFSDGRTASGQNVSMVFPVDSPTVTVQLTVNNGFCSDTKSVIITLGNIFNAAFTASTGDTICINTPVNFIDGSTGTLTNYLWNFGDLTQFNGQTPPTHIYIVSNIYNVQLIVTDNHGCRDTANKLMHVDASALIDFTGLKPQYCTDKTVTLKRVISHNITSYVWDNGDGKTFSNEVDVNFSYPNEGVYTITLSGVDKYCGPATVSKTVPVYSVPRVNLGSDTVLCFDNRLLIGVQPQPNYTYLWGTGETTSQIYTWAFFNMEYSLFADNHGCRGYDAIYVKVLPFCLIKVPNAFTPNGDGLNDQLKALNSDLAKDFSFNVYNRMGQLVFTTNNPLKGWDGNFRGNPQSAGTYVWYLSYIDPWNGKPVKEKGTSILIR